MKIEAFEDIEAWKAARTLSRAVHEATRARPPAMDEDLKRQMRKAAISSMANIAEGFDAGTDPEFVRFLRMARRSATEVQSHLYVALDEKYVKKEQFGPLYAQAKKVKELIGGFIRYLRS